MGRPARLKNASGLTAVALAKEGCLSSILLQCARRRWPGWWYVI